MPDIAEMDSYAMLCQDWGSAYRITRTPGTARPYQAERRDDPRSVQLAERQGELKAHARLRIALQRERGVGQRAGLPLLESGEGGGNHSAIGGVEDQDDACQLLCLLRQLWIVPLEHRLGEFQSERRP